MYTLRCTYFRTVLRFGALAKHFFALSVVFLLLPLGTLAGTVNGVPPSVLLSVTPGPGSATLSWSFTGSAGSFNIYRGLSPGEEILYRTDIGGISFFDSGLTNGTTYYYIVAPVNIIGQGALSNEVSVTPGTALLAAPMVSAVPGDSQVTLSWDAISEATAYNVYRSTRPNPDAGDLYAVGVADDTMFTDMNVTNATTYYYVVTAVNADGQGAGSNPASATPGDIFPVPARVAATPGGSSATLNWNFTGSATSFNIYRGTSPDEETLYRPGIGGTSFFDSGLTDGTTYFYKVTSVNQATESDFSNEVSVTPGVSLLIPPLLAAVSGDNQVTLSWSAVPLATSYNIYRSRRPGQEDLYQVGIAKGTSFTDTNVSNGTTYYYVVAAVNVNGQGRGSNEASATPGSMGPPSPLLAATAGDSSASLNWNFIGSANAFNIYRGTNPGEETLYRTGVGGTSFFDSGLTNGTTYYYTITAVNTNSEGAASLEVSVTPGAALLAAPLLVAQPGGGQVTLSWTAVSQATSYNIYRGTRAGQEELYQVGVAKSTTFTDTSVASGTTYYYFVYAVNADGQGRSSNRASATP